MSTPLVSVMITVHNCALYLGEAIQSVLRQTYNPVELIVVDDGSTDGSGDIADAYTPRLRYVYQPRAGMGAARNRAVELAKGALYGFLDADDRYVPGKVDLQMEAFRRHPVVEAVFGHVTEFVSPDLDEASARRLRQPRQRIPGHFAAAMLIRREAFLRVGPFATDLKVGVGLDWYARAVDRGLRRLMLDEVILERRLHAENNGLRQRHSKAQYPLVLKGALDRRRKAIPPPEPSPDRRDPGL
jgi:glycosyltransferase involved in cell wall biosynthesis